MDEQQIEGERVSVQDYDVVVLGAGSGGYAAALRAAQLGSTVALVEADEVGGTCLHRGCIPTKALLHAASVADTVRDAERVGIRASLDGIDVPAMLAYQRGVVRRLHRGLNGLISSRSIDVVRGWGRLTGPDTVQVGERTLRGSHVVLATGSRTKSLPGLEMGGRVLGSEQALAMDWVPATAVVLGGGVIGVEMASIWRSLGAEVTLVEAAERLVPAEDDAISPVLARAFGRRGITVRTSTRLDRAEQHDTGVSVHLSDGTAVEPEVVLVAVGREPATAGLGFAEQGLILDEAGFVAVDDHLRTGVGSIWAVGDVVAGSQLAHRGFAHGIAVAERIHGLEPAPLREESIPKVTYCDPEIASVGLTEAQARERYENVETVRYDLGGNGRSQIVGAFGLVKMVRVSDGPVVGVHMIGSDMGEQIGEGQLIVDWEAFPDDVAALLHAHPTQNESLGEAAMALAGKPLHSHV